MFILSQNHRVKCYDNRALTNRSAMSIAAVLVGISLMSSLPETRVLQADNDTVFKGAGGNCIVSTEADIHEIIEKVGGLWPDCRMVNRRACHSQCQFPAVFFACLWTLQRVISYYRPLRWNRKVQSHSHREAGSAWMTDKKSSKWATLGHMFVRWAINTA